MTDNATYALNQKTSIIAEISCSHNGDPERALRLVHEASISGADIIKFQVFRAEDIASPYHPDFASFKKLEIPIETWKNIFDFSRMKGLKIYCDIFNNNFLEKVILMGCNGLKIYSSDLGNFPLLDAIGSSKLPILISVDRSLPRDVWIALDHLLKRGNQKLTVQLGYNASPTNYEDCQLSALTWFKNTFGFPVGYADHLDGGTEMAIILPSLAVSLGATVIEKHLTVDRENKPKGFEVSLEPAHFKKMVSMIRDSESILGNSIPKQFLDENNSLINSKEMGKFPFSNIPLSKNDAIEYSHIIFKITPEIHGVFPADLRDIYGKKVKHNHPAGKIIHGFHVNQKIVGLINARTKSSRLPQKALFPILGKSTLEIIIERVMCSKLIDQIILCTTTDSSDDILEQISNKVGIPCFRGPYEDVMGRLIMAAQKFSGDIIVRITGDDVLTDALYIDRAIHQHLSLNAEYTYVKGLPIGVDREIITTRTLSWIHNHLNNSQKTEHITWYLNSPMFVRIACLNASPEHWRPDYRLTLDTENDFQLISWIFEQLHEEYGFTFGIDPLIKLLDQNPDKITINSKIKSEVKRENVDTSLNLNFFNSRPVKQ